MNITDGKYYAQLIMSGTSEPKQIEGTIEHIFRIAQGYLRVTSLRENKDGKTIDIKISSRPFIEKQLSIAEESANWRKQLGDPSLIIGGPEPDESYEQFYERLCERMQESIAAQMANDWFDRPQDPLTIKYMNDPQVKRFNLLNASSAAFAEALPTEYESLKKYIKSVYPQFAERIKWRTAF